MLKIDNSDKKNIYKISYDINENKLDNIKDEIKVKYDEYKRHIYMLNKKYYNIILEYIQTAISLS